MKISAHRESNTFRLVALLSGALAVFFGFLGLSGWFLGLPVLTNLGSAYIPMATSTCIAFLVQGAILILHIRCPSCARRWLFVALVAVTSIFGIVTLAEHLAIFNLNFKWVIFPPADHFGLYPANVMSPLTGALFFLTGAALLLLLRFEAGRSTPHVVSALASLTAMVGLIGIMSYAYGTPLLYGGPMVPMALGAGAAFTFLGSGLLAAAGPDGFLLRPLTGGSVRAKLLRTFVPLGFTAVIGSDLLQKLITRPNSAFMSAASALFYGIVTVVVVARAARTIGGAIETAEAKHKQADESLKRISDQKELILASAGEGILGLDLQGIITFVNPMGAHMLGWGAAELAGRSIHETAHHTRLDGGIFAREECPILGALRKGKMLQLSEDVFWRKDGTKFPVEYLSTPIMEEDKPVGAVTTFRDITDRKQAEDRLRESEKRYRLFVETASEGVWAFDARHHVTFVNQVMCDMLGYGFEEIIGRPVSSFIFEDELDDHNSRIRGREGGLGEKYERKFRRKDGEVLWVIVSAKALMDENGGFQGAFAMLTDITGRKRMENALRDSQERLHLALESGRAGTWDRDIVADKAVWDDYVHELFGLAPGTFSGKLEDFIHMLHPDDQERVRAEMAAAFNGGVDFATTYRVVWPDSSVHFIADRGKAYRDSAGRTVRLTGVNWDFTELHRAEEALRQSEERLRLSLEATNDGIWDWNVPTGNAVLSPRCYTMLGYEPYEFPEHFRSWISLVHPDEIRRTELEIFKHISSGEGYSIEVRIRNKSGGWQWILTRGRVVERDVNGNPVRMVGTHSDITARRQAEEALRESEDQFRTLVLSAPDAIFIQVGGRFVYVNDAAIRLYGAASERELLGHDIVERIHPDCRAKTMERIRSINEEGGPGSLMEQKHLKLDGTTIDVETHSAPIRYRKSEGALVFVRDITERKQTEESLLLSEDRYKRLFEDAVLGIFRSTPEGKIINANPAYARMFGFDSPEEAKSQIDDVAVDLFVDPSRRNEILRQVLNVREPVRAENRYKRKDGSIFTGNIHAWAVRDRDGKFLYLEGFVEDITERKRAEEEKEMLETQLRQAQKLEAIGTLAGGIAHDFNNILVPIIGYTEMALSDTPHFNPMRYGLEQTLEAAKRARDLVKQILTFGRFGKELQQMPVEMSLVVKEALKLLRASLPSSIEIRQNIVDGVVSADPTQIHQVLMNLCTNAAHAMDGEGILEVRLSRLDLGESDFTDQPIVDLKPGPYMKLSVSDTGIGMDKHTLERIFDPYFTTKEVGKGNGLGLAVVHGIVKRLQGNIAIRSEPGKGTTFSIHIPAVEASTGPFVEARHVLPTGTESLLLIDDEQNVVEMGTAILERLGYKVTPETNSPRALEIFRSRPGEFDLIITDYTMPKLTGMDLSREIRKIRSDIPIILCTGFSEKITAEGARELGMELVMKPFGMKQIAELIRKVLGARKSLEQGEP